jgi:hypothetical protein
MSSPPEPKRPPVPKMEEANKEVNEMLLQKRKARGYGATMVAGAFQPSGSGSGNTMGQNTTLGG